MKKLKEKYEKHVNEYLSIFIKKHDLPEIEFWVSGEVGGIVMIGDYYFNFNDIKLDIDNDISNKTIFDWYDFCIETTSSVSYRQWIKGYRPIKCWLSLCYSYFDINIAKTSEAFKYADDNNFELKSEEHFDFSLNSDHQYVIMQYLGELSNCQKLIIPKNYSEFNYGRLEHDFFLLNEKRNENDIIYI